MINAVNIFMKPIAEINPTGREPIANYDFRTLELEKAQRQFKNLQSENITEEEKAQQLFALISGSFVHTPSYNHIKPWENWILWMGGTLKDKKFLRSYNPDLLWKKGGGFCSQAALIFAAKGQGLGLKTRLIGLTGHVVAEVYLPDKGWRVVDPDMGIFWDNSIDSFGIHPSEEEIKHKLLARGFSEELSQKFASIYTSQENNFYKQYPPSPDRILLEELSNWLKWVIPFVLIGTGLSKKGSSFRTRFTRARIQYGI